MYTAVLLVAMSTGAETADFGRRGCRGCSGCCYAYGCSTYYGCCGGNYRTASYGAPGPYYASGMYSPGMVVQGPATQIRQSNYFEPTPDAAMVRVMVPHPDTEIWFDEVATRQRGGERVFLSPRLAAGGKYFYTVRAKWMDNGQPVEQTRRVQVQAGQPNVIDFRTSAPGGVKMPSLPGAKGTTKPASEPK